MVLTLIFYSPVLNLIEYISKKKYHHLLAIQLISGSILFIRHCHTSLQLGSLVIIPDVYYSNYIASSLMQHALCYSGILSLQLILGTPIRIEASLTIKFGLHSTVITELIKDVGVLRSLTFIYYFHKCSISSVQLHSTRNKKIFYF